LRLEGAAELGVAAYLAIHLIQLLVPYIALTYFGGFELEQKAKAAMAGKQRRLQLLWCCSSLLALMSSRL
jgi:hypothetical protein